MRLKPPPDSGQPDPITVIDDWINQHIRGIWLVGGILADALIWLINAAFDIVDKLTDVVLFLASLAINALSAVVGNIWQACLWWFNLVGILWTWLNNAGNALWGWFIHAEEWLTARLSSFFGWVWANVVKPAIDAVVGSLDWLYRYVVAPVVDWIAHAAQLIGGWIGDAVSWFYANVIRPIIAEAARIWSVVASLWDWFTKLAATAVDIVWKASAFLLWIIAHPASWFAALTGDFTRQGQHSLTQRFRAVVAGEHHLIDDFLSSFIDKL